MKHIFAISLRKLGGGALLRLAFLATLVLTVSACVSPGPVREAMVCGKKVTFHPDDLKPCNRGASACAIQTQATYNIHYSTLDESVLGHEEEHVCGMRHREPWVPVGGKVCTVVTDGGTTGWKRGDIMCRVDAGPPIKMTDVRLQEFFSLNSR